MRHQPTQANLIQQPRLIDSLQLRDGAERCRVDEQNMDLPDALDDRPPALGQPGRVLGQVGNHHSAGALALAEGHSRPPCEAGRLARDSGRGGGHDPVRPVEGSSPVDRAVVHAGEFLVLGAGDKPSARAEGSSGREYAGLGVVTLWSAEGDDADVASCHESRWCSAVMSLPTLSSSVAGRLPLRSRADAGLSRDRPRPG